MCGVDVILLASALFILFIKVILAIRGLLSDIYYDPENAKVLIPRVWWDIFLNLQIE